MSKELTLSETIALALVGTADPSCELCGAPAFVNCGGHLYCKAEWQEGTCDEKRAAADAAMAEGAGR
jgi:hypothetical protein